MIVIIICWITFLLIWIISSRNTKSTNTGKGLQWWNIIPFGSVIVLYLISQIDFFEIVGVRIWKPDFTMEVAFSILAIFGLIILLLARFELGRNWSFKVVLKENHELITSGLYSYVMHPIYTGLLLLVLASFLWLGNLAGFIVLIIVFISFLYKAYSEEKLLKTYFGEKYTTYKYRTKLLIPFIF